MMARRSIVSALFVAMYGGASTAAAETFTVTPEDEEGWTIIEAAGPGDEVLVAPGTYQYRVYLDAAGSEGAPIVIRAEDPNHRPVWDLLGDESNPVDSWPGSYGAGDNHRGCWQVAEDGAYYEISDIVFRNCRAPSSSGLRMINSGPVTVRNCLFEQNTNGLTGASEDLVVESCEFRENGKVWEGGNMTHNIYLFGGRFTMRYCYNHDSHEGQLFHIRAYESLIEYNWLARPAGYMGDIMTCEFLCGPDTSLQHMTLRGNVMIQGTPANGSQIIALYKDEDGDVSNMSIDLLYNTIIGTPRGGDHFLVHMVNEGIETHATFYNNIIYQVADLVGVESLQSIWSAEGANNWVSDGTNDAGLPGTLTGSDPGFADPAALDFTLTSDAPVRGQADTSIDGLPAREYYRNETVAMQSRERLSANDLGAFELREPGGDTDAGGDEDTDTGTDDATDAGTDADAGGDADGDTDTDADSDADTDADADNDADADTDNDADADTDADADNDTDADADNDTDADADNDADGDTDADADGDTDGDADGDADTELDTEDQDAGSSATGGGGGCGCRLTGVPSRGSIVDVMRVLF